MTDKAKEERERLIDLICEARSECSSFGHMWPPDFAIEVKALIRWLESGAKGKPVITKYTDDSI